MRLPQLATPGWSPSTIMRSKPEAAGKSPAQAAMALEEFLSRGKATVCLSGAGISVDSNIPDYRGPSGTYTLNNNYRPIFFSEFVGKDIARRRYWSRSYLGYPPVVRAQPNFTHLALAKLAIDGVVQHNVTQNVDSLLHRAFHSLGSFSEDTLNRMILELHGTLRDVVCLHCHERASRAQIQEELTRLNPRWSQLLLMDERDLKINADGDVDLVSMGTKFNEKFEYRTFRYPPCPHCLQRYGDSALIQIDSDGAWVGGTAGIIKPAVIFFGENVPSEIRNLVNEIIETSDQVLVIGTTLAVLSAQRLVRAAKAQGKRIAIVTSGYVRNEETLLEDGDLRIWWRSSEVLEHLASLKDIPVTPAYDKTVDL